MQLRGVSVHCGVVWCGVVGVDRFLNLRWCRQSCMCGGPVGFG